MKVKDRVTGSVLENNNETVMDGWLANPDRFVPVEDTEEAKKSATTPKPATTKKG